MKKILIVLAAIVLFGACKRTQQEVTSTDEHRWKFDKLSEKRELFLNNDSTKKGMQLNLEFNYPSEFENDSILKLVQSAFVVAFSGEDFKAMPPKAAFDIFEKQVVEENLSLGKLAEGDGPDFSTYFKNVATTVFDTTNIIITAKTTAEDYTGGAHGSHQTFYYNISLKTGNTIHEKDLFKKGSEEQLASMIKGVLDERNKNPELAVTIIYPEGVVPNGNFYFNDKGIVYVYNTYEITPYSDGLIEVTIPYDNIKELINPEYKELISIKTKTE